MHEVDMTRCLMLSLETWRQSVDGDPPTVSAVHLQVGDFTCVEPEQLRFTWGVAIQGSWLEGAALEIETVPLVGRCLGCEATYSPDAALAYRSPCCDHPMEEIVSGRELRIRSIEQRLPDPEELIPCT